MYTIFAPILNSTAGLTLTPAQWQRTGLTYFGLDALPLLQRPEYAQQVQVPGRLIIDARNLSVTRSGQVSYRGTDGAKCQMPVDEMLDYFAKLNPDYIAHDKGLPENILVSDVLSNKAYTGYFIADGKMFSILSDAYVMDFQILEASCGCESCEQGFTRAYLHHLFQHTPMLAQRYLMMHNMFVASRAPESILHLINAL